MSGGSFCYLCDAGSITDLAAKRTELEEMADWLANAGGQFPGVDVSYALRETRRLLTFLAMTERMLHRLPELRQVWKAVEWYVSGDYGQDQVQEALAAHATAFQAAQDRLP